MQKQEETMKQTLVRHNYNKHLKVIINKVKREVTDLENVF